MYIRPKHSRDKIPIACGKCLICYKRKISQWSFRLMQQEKVCVSAYFITLTYATKNVPISDEGYLSLSKRDVQLFYKSLRKLHSQYSKQLRKACRKLGTKVPEQPSIKYYTVGEYGTRTKRPHYHAILFNAQLELIQGAWDHGGVHYGEVTPASIHYTLSYMCKPRKVPEFDGDDRSKEFALMSKGLGKSYITEKMVQWHLADLENRMYCNLEGGKKIAMPRYYKDKIYSEMERKRIAHFQKVKAIADEEKRLLQETAEDQWNRLQLHLNQVRIMEKKQLSRIKL